MSDQGFYYASSLRDLFVKSYFHKFHDFDPNSCKMFNLQYRYFFICLVLIVLVVKKPNKVMKVLIFQMLFFCMMFLL